VQGQHLSISLPDTLSVTTATTLGTLDIENTEVCFISPIYKKWQYNTYVPDVLLIAFKHEVSVISCSFS